MVSDLYEDMQMGKLKSSLDARILRPSVSNDLDLMLDDLCVNSLVTICGLRSRACLNGSLCRVLDRAEQDRIPVGILD